jgi:hypothetical protein
MGNAFDQVVQTVNNYVGNLVDVAEMSDEDKAALKDHLLKAEQILLRNGNTKLQEVLSALTHSFLSRL